MDTSAIERFVGVDVSQTGDHRLIQERRFDRSLGRRQPLSESIRREFPRERLWSQPGKGRIEVSFSYKRKATKLARVAVEQAAPVIQREADARVRIFRGGRRDIQIARHAPMDRQDIAPVEEDEQELAPATNASDCLPRDALRELPRVHIANSARPGYMRGDDAASNQLRLKLPRDKFNLG